MVLKAFVSYPINNMRYSSADGRFGLDVGEKEFSKILKDCQGSDGHETGGILVGKYTKNHDCALTTVITTAPNDSSKKRTTFFRGSEGLSDILGDLWTKKKEYYLGEWHFHPFAVPTPSGIDINQMREIARTTSYKCPEPVMLILGGDPVGEYVVRVFVFPDGEMIELYSA
jgi:integrative and conjugative element protein (TIGR02256 family)